MPSDKKSTTWLHLDKYLGPIQWRWPQWLPCGFITVLAAEPGAGKSLLALHLAAALLHSAHDPAPTWPDGAPVVVSPGPAASAAIIWCESEAGHAINLDRARRLNLDLSRIVNPLPDPLDNFRLDLAGHTTALLHHARQPHTRLIVLDSLRGLRAGGANSKPLSFILNQLADIARIAQQPILLTHHLRKRAALDAAPRIDHLLGASAIAQTARVIWTIDTPDPLRPHHRRLSLIKSNLGPLPEPLGFTITPAGHIQFGPAPQPPDARSEIDRAADFLHELLQPTPLPALHVEQLARAAGFNPRTLRRAKARLAIRSIRLPGHRAWHWSLPSNT